MATVRRAEGGVTGRGLGVSLPSPPPDPGAVFSQNRRPSASQRWLEPSLVTKLETRLQLLEKLDLTARAPQCSRDYKDELAATNRRSATPRGGRSSIERWPVRVSKSINPIHLVRSPVGPVPDEGMESGLLSSGSLTMYSCARCLSGDTEPMRLFPSICVP
jgi:hypothetical protein